LPLFRETAPGLAQLSLILWLLTASFPIGQIAFSTAATSAAFQQPSWGSGVVLPEGSKLEGGGALSWANARNITVVVQLPEIEFPSQTVYAIESVMTEDGTVLQVAAGIYPGNSGWLVYSMYIADVSQEPQRYIWVVNSSLPRAAPGDIESISVYRSQNEGWSFRVADMRTSSEVQHSFDLSSNQPIKPGDQELFALESYSWDYSTFEQMGSMALESIFVDGQRVSGGLYSYSGWDLVHSPLFIVGGAAPPQFISLGLNGSSEASWSYAEVWQGDIQVGFNLAVVAVLSVLPGVALLLIILDHRRRR
jgi:hypothetical protein